MKGKMTALVVLVMASAISFSTVAPAAPAPKAAEAATSRTAAAAASPAAVPQDHPEIRDAIDSLRRAKAHLIAARHDYKGHREAAVRATDEAIRQLEICLKFD
jgi:Rieske Fe-S protein